MNLVRVGQNVLNFDAVLWIEVAEGRPTVHLQGGVDFRPRTDEEAADLHRIVTSHLTVGERAKIPAYGAWKKN